jgi:hypothetical protein
MGVSLIFSSDRGVTRSKSFLARESSKQSDRANFPIHREPGTCVKQPVDARQLFVRFGIHKAHNESHLFQKMKDREDDAFFVIRATKKVGGEKQSRFVYL